jgi:hypothetical protein
MELPAIRQKGKVGTLLPVAANSAGLIKIGSALQDLGQLCGKIAGEMAHHEIQMKVLADKERQEAQEVDAHTALNDVQLRMDQARTELDRNPEINFTNYADQHAEVVKKFRDEFGEYFKAAGQGGSATVRQALQRRCHNPAGKGP